MTSTRELTDKNLIISVEEVKREVWINTNGTFWRGSLDELLSFLHDNAETCNTNQPTVEDGNNVKVDTCSD
jgi:hypothetical protein